MCSPLAVDQGLRYALAITAKLVTLNRRLIRFHFHGM